MSNPLVLRRSVVRLSSQGFETVDDAVAVERALEIRKLAVEVLKVMQAEAPSIFSDYELVPLADGSQATRTVHPKV